MNKKKIKRYIKIFYLLVFQVASLKAQQQSDFASPLDIPLQLAGNFGELRPNHFHAGLDLKTQGKEGLPIYAVNDGYVSRIKVDCYGYGKALYITHPNGYTTVYAHLQKFSPTIENYVKKMQYAKKSYEIELFPKKNEFVVKKREQIAYGGNTGGSAGPHLHFEVRDSTAKATNPLLYGYEIADTIAPNVYQIVGYSLSENAQIDYSQLPQQLNATKQPDGSFLCDKIDAVGVIGFGIQAIDKQNGTHHQNGVYKVTLQLNGTTQLQYVFDKLRFDESRYINTLIDFELWHEKKSRVQLLYKTKGNALSTIYTAAKNNGFLDIKEGFSYTAIILAEDFKGNQTKIVIPIEGKKMELKTPFKTKNGKQLFANRDAYFSFEKGNVYFPEKTFYEDIILDIQSVNDTIKIHNPSVAVHKNYTLSVENKTFTETEIPQVFIANIGEKKQIWAENTSYKDGFFQTKTRNLGNFVLMKDVSSPTIKPLNFKDKATFSGNELKIQLKDNLTGIKNYSVSLNGVWVLFENEPKNNTITFSFSDIKNQQLPLPEKGNFKLEITAQDGVGNVQKAIYNFNRK